MRIIELNIVEFGCLKDRHICLEQGINVISGENESGKSTVMLFIKFMLYGLPRKNAKGTDRDRALSFDGHRAAGTMTVEKDGKQYKIERQAHGTTRLSESLKIIDLGTGEQLNGEAGELLLGVPCEVFENSCSVSQMKTDINKAQAASGVENLLVSADESIDVKKICERLDALRKEYRLNKGEGGILYRTESEISALRVKQREATEKYLRYNQTSTRLERKTAELKYAEEALKQAEERLDGIQKAEIIARFDTLAKNKVALGQKKAKLANTEASFNGNISPTRENAARIRTAADTLSAELLKLINREKEYGALEPIDESDTLAQTGEEILSSGGKATVMSKITKLNAHSRGQRTAFFVALLLCALSVPVAFLLWGDPVLRIAALAFAAVCAAAGVLALTLSVSSKKKRDAACAKFEKRYQELEAHLDLCLERAMKKRKNSETILAARTRLEGAKEQASAAKQKLIGLLSLDDNTPSELALKKAGSDSALIEQFCDIREQLSKEIYMLEALVDNDARALAQFDETELRESAGKDTAYSPSLLAEAERAVKFNRAKLASLSNEVSALKETLAGLSAGLGQSPVELADRIAALQEKLEKDTQFFDALVLAKQSIEEASLCMSGNVTPAISRKAGELLGAISGGRYASVHTTKALELSVEQDGFNVSADLLSGGTRDAAYICLRISLMMRLFGEELPPLILDEALCQLDDTRVKEMLTLLYKLGTMGLQTLLFTCHGREQEFCKQMNIEINSISMN